MVMPLIKNAAQCNACGDVIESKHRHDFVSCKCGAIFIDGGLDYLRGGGRPEDFISLVEYSDESPTSLASSQEPAYLSEEPNV